MSDIKLIIVAVTLQWEQTRLKEVPRDYYCYCMNYCCVRVACVLFLNRAS